MVKMICVGQFLVWYKSVRFSMFFTFFTLFNISFRESSLMLKLAFAKKDLLNFQKFSLSLYLRYEPIYRQIYEVKSEL
jgi:hypothetical protein